MAKIAHAPQTSDATHAAELRKILKAAGMYRNGMTIDEMRPLARELRRMGGKPMASLETILSKIRALSEQPPSVESASARAEHHATFRDQLVGRGVGRKFIDVDLRNLPGWLPHGYHAAAKMLLTLLERPKLMAIGGERGQGKTALAAGLVRAFTEAGRYAFLLTATKFVNDVMFASFDRRQRTIEKYERADLVVIDEVQVRPRTANGDAMIIELVDARYANMRSTLLLTNYAAEPFYEFCGDSIRRRIDESGGFTVTNWPMIETLRPSN